jgi:hypothetical protein
MNVNIREFFTLQETQYSGRRPQTTYPSVFPRIFRRVLDILGCEELGIYKELHAAFVPPVTNYVFTLEDGLTTPSSRTQVARAVAQLHEKLNIILTDSDQPENMWAIVPRCN